MSKPLKKKTKILLALLIVAVLLGTCFFCVALYAKNEFSKERSWLPPKFAPQQSSVTELPDNVQDAYTYVMRLYDEALHSDIVEASCHTDIDLTGDLTLPFGETDNAIITKIRDGAKDAVQALYPVADGVRLSEAKPEDLPALDLQASEILEYNYDAESIFNRKGEYKSDTYEIVFNVDPAFESIDDIRQSSVYAGVCDILKDAVTVNNIDPDVRNVEIRFSVDRLTDRLLNVSISRSYEITADVTITDAYAALLNDAETKDVTIVLPYKATEHIGFMWFGLHFTKDYIEQRPDDIITLPLDIHVNAAAVQGEDFRVEYTISDPQTMEIDEDAVMTVKKTNDVSDSEGVKITATLYYEGKTFTDDMIVYITNLEKTKTGVRFWEDSFSVGLGETSPLPVDIRVPVNEQSEQRTEEEYSLAIEVSDPEALTIEVEGKDLFATALKPSADPVTVKVTMECGGHTYAAEIPVTITQGTEAIPNV